MQSRRLLVIRHARAGQGTGTDAERPLTDDGAQVAEAVGSWLADHDLRPDRALVSSALRAVETWAAIARGAGWELEPQESPPLYTAEPESALDLVREVDAAVATLALVGHNPTVGSLVQLLDDGEGDPDAGTALATSGFPPGAVAVLRHDGDWADLAWGSARLVAYRSGG